MKFTTSKEKFAKFLQFAICIVNMNKRKFVDENDKTVEPPNKKKYQNKKHSLAKRRGEAIKLMF